MNEEAILVFVTAPSQESASKIAGVLLERKLAACVNILTGLRSLYLWEEKISDDEEALMIIKSRKSLFENYLVPTIITIHPYEVPEIIALPIQMGSPAYLEWLFNVTEVPD